MSVYFKFLLLWCLISSSTDILSQNDMLKDRITKYNNIKSIQPNIIRIDSAKIIMNTDYTKAYPNVEYSTHIIVRKKEKNSLLFFFTCLGFVLIISWIRIGLSMNFNSQVSNYFRLKHRIKIDYSKLVVLMINTIFILLIVHVLTKLFFGSSINLDVSRTFSDSYVLLLLICLFVLFRYTIGFIVQSVFNQKQLFSAVNYYWIDLVFIYLCIALPLVMVVSVSNLYSEIIVYYFVILLFVVMYLVSFTKLLYNEMNNFRTSVIKFVIYFYTVEFIPLVLLVKFLRKYFLIS